MPVEVEFTVSTTKMHFEASERSSLPVAIDVIVPEERTSNFGNDTKRETVEIVFPFFARIEYVMMNFWEVNYDDFQINNEYRDNLGFYQMINSSWDKSIYDPMQRLDLEHFLIVGYDSYLEVLANRYFTVRTLE